MHANGTGRCGSLSAPALNNVDMEARLPHYGPHLKPGMRLVARAACCFLCKFAVTNCTTLPTTNTDVATAYVCPYNNSLAGDVCYATCLDGYAGGLTATCTAGTWVYTGTCVKKGMCDYNAQRLVMPQCLPSSATLPHLVRMPTLSRMEVASSRARQSCLPQG